MEGDRAGERYTASNFKHFWDHAGNFSTINEELLVFVAGKHKNAFQLPDTQYE